MPDVPRQEDRAERGAAGSVTKGEAAKELEKLLRYGADTMTRQADAIRDGHPPDPTVIERFPQLSAEQFFLCRFIHTKKGKSED